MLSRYAASFLSFGLILATPPAAESAVAQEPSASRDGTHDFDFNIGTWKTHISRLLHPLSGSNNWTQYDGRSVVRPFWNGHADIFELEAAGPVGKIEGVGLRLYNPETRQWSLNWASGRNAS